MVTEKFHPVVLIRGLPGSGKSTYAKTHFPDHVLIEADDYFTVEGPHESHYLFDPQVLKEAHKWTVWRAERLFAHNIPFVVSNTFSRVWEMEPYLWMKPKVICLKTQFKNIHNVPPHTIKNMKQRWEPLEGEKVIYG